MILKIQQTQVLHDLAWQGTNVINNNIIVVAKAPFVQGKYNINIQYDGYNQNLYYCPTDTTYGTSLEDRLSFKLFENGEKVGSIVARNQKVKGWFKSYQYYEFAYKDTIYKGYVVGMGKSGSYLCVYRNDTIIAMVQKIPSVKNFQDVYNAYIDDGADLPIVMPLLLYWDSVQYSNLMELKPMEDWGLTSKKTEIVLTHQPELKAKYDPTFIDRVLDKSVRTEKP